jgi:hypothetical protein
MTARLEAALSAWLENRRTRRALLDHQYQNDALNAAFFDSIEREVLVTLELEEAFTEHQKARVAA